jgi:PAS domain S-box-containing protein
MKLGGPTESLLKSLPDGVFVTDPNGCITWTNPAFSDMCGRKLTEIIGKRPESFLLGPDTDPQAANQVGEAFMQKRPVETELVNYRSDGKPFWARLAIQPVENKRGTVRGFIGIEQDFSAARKRTHALENEIARLYQILIDVAPALGADRG